MTYAGPVPGSRRVVLIRLAAALALTAGGFAVLQAPGRRGETWLSVEIAKLFGSTRFQVLRGTSILELPHRGPPFLAVITPSCSAVAPVVSLLALVTLIPTATWRRRAMATTAAAVIVVVGNVVRIAGSLVVGLWAGQVSLVMFHDWVGSIFAFAYTLGGFIVMLYVLLPNRGEHDPQPTAAVTSAPVGIHV